jgi:hypothetical protein
MAALCHRQGLGSNLKRVMLSPEIGGGKCVIYGLTRKNGRLLWVFRRNHSAGVTYQQC